MLAQSEDFKILLVFCPVSSKFNFFTASKISFGEEEITLIENQFNQSGHAKEIVIKFNEETGLVVNEELLYIENEPFIATNSAVLPLAFFDALKQKDFSLARHYLTEELKRSVSSAALEEYFGEFYEVVPYNFNSSKGYYAAIKTAGKTKIFCFKVINGEIAEIEAVKEWFYYFKDCYILK